MKEKILAVPTNIITGFLGSGKTSTILSLLKSKPSSERWAILVNEFGQIGIDGSLINPYNSKEKSIFVREIPGGCMCCTSNLPMQIALNQLLIMSKPDRLLIEPTGLGHPIEVISELLNEYYSEILSINKIVTLVDPRNLNEKRYADNKIFNEQISIADIIVGNKNDLCSSDDNELLVGHSKKHTLFNPKIIFTNHGKLDLDILQGSTCFSKEKLSMYSGRSENINKEDFSFSEASYGDRYYLRSTNSTGDFQSVSWRFKSSAIFSKENLLNFLTQLNAIRVKAIIISEEGILGLNISNDNIDEFFLMRL
tara:strand:- start:3859 stop:4788 length:930 start_codon:yes stop_codon:yes gene_type:complete